MVTLEEPSFNVLRAWRISFASAFSWDVEICKSSCRSVAVTKIHLFSGDNIFKYEFNKSIFAIRVS